MRTRTGESDGERDNSQKRDPEILFLFLATSDWVIFFSCFATNLESALRWRRFGGGTCVLSGTVESELYLGRGRVRAEPS